MLVHAMGSVSEGTLCSYCGVNPAGYIPDGAVGPMCMGWPKACFDRSENGGVYAIMGLRLRRKTRAVFARLEQAPHAQKMPDSVAELVASYVWKPE